MKLDSFEWYLELNFWAQWNYIHITPGDSQVLRYRVKYVFVKLLLFLFLFFSYFLLFSWGGGGGGHDFIFRYVALQTIILRKTIAKIILMYFIHV